MKAPFSRRNSKQMGMYLLVFVVILMIVFVATSFMISRVQKEQAISSDEDDFHRHILHNTKPPK